MMRSLFSGVSGLKVHQTRMDVIGNNIANINTVGYKSSRVTFSDILSQTQSGASAPTDNIGGINPQQIGLGVSVASIDLLFTDASTQSTGKNTDLALSGNGLFVVKNGDSTYYTRDGAFEFDKNGYYTLSGSGYKVQGWNAVDGSLNTNSQPTDIIVPNGKIMEAAATTSVSFTGNLNANEPLITLIDGRTQPTTYTVPKGKTSILTLTSKTNGVNDTTHGDGGNTYTIGHSVPNSTIIQVYDTQGMAHNIPLQFEKTKANTWVASLQSLTTSQGIDLTTNTTYTTTVYAYVQESDGTYTRVSFVDNDTNGLITSFTINFDSTGNPIGTLTCGVRLEYNFYLREGSDPPFYIQAPPSYVVRGGVNTFVTVNYAGGTYATATGVNGSTITEPSIDFSGLTQVSRAYSANPTADGNTAGILNKISVNKLGIITGSYTNGKNQFEAQVAVAQFTNASGLTKEGGNIYSESNNSGSANIRTAPDLGLTITPSSLEMSNVDLANEFSEMIITQRGFQANSKIINVGDEMLETLVNMKR